MEGKRTDANQKQIVSELRDIGCSVFVLSSVGKGCPDILVGYRGKNYLFEIKLTHKHKLTAAESDFRDNWRGDVTIITSFEEALEYLDIY
jgi:Holliday junction resolvase